MTSSIHESHTRKTYTDPSLKQKKANKKPEYSTSPIADQERRDTYVHVRPVKEMYGDRMKENLRSKVKINNPEELGISYLLSDPSMTIEEALMRLPREKRLTFALGFSKKTDGSFVMKAKDNQKYIAEDRMSHRVAPQVGCTAFDVAQLRSFFEKETPIFTYAKQSDAFVLHVLGKSGTIDIKLQNPQQLEGLFAVFPSAYKALAKDVLGDLGVTQTQITKKKDVHSLIELVLKKEGVTKGKLKEKENGEVEIQLEDGEKKNKGSWVASKVDDGLKLFLKSFPTVRFVVSKAKQAAESVRTTLEGVKHKAEHFFQPQPAEKKEQQSGELGELYRLLQLEKVKNAIHSKGIYGVQGLEVLLHIEGFKKEAIWLVEALRGLYLQMTKNGQPTAFYMATVRSALQRYFPKSNQEKLELLLDHATNLVRALTPFIPKTFPKKPHHEEIVDEGELSTSHSNTVPPSYKKAQQDVKNELLRGDQGSSFYDRAVKQGLSFLRRWF